MEYRSIAMPAIVVCSLLMLISAAALDLPPSPIWDSPPIYLPPHEDWFNFATECNSYFVNNIKPKAGDQKCCTASENVNADWGSGTKLEFCKYIDGKYTSLKPLFLHCKMRALPNICNISSISSAYYYLNSCTPPIHARDCGKH